MRNALKVLFVVALAIPTLASATIINTKHNLSANNNQTSPHTNDGTVDLCKFCHLVHDANTTAGTLWARQAPVVGNNGFTSPNTTSNGTPLPAQINNYTTNSGTSRCLSCHDGSIALNVITNAVTGASLITPAANMLPGAGTLSTVGSNVFLRGTTWMTNLNGQHPVAIPFAGQISGGVTSLATAAEYGTATNAGCLGLTLCVTGGSVPAAGNYIKLYGGVGTASMECGSCHQPHLENLGSNAFFLRVPSTITNGRCGACHKK